MKRILTLVAALLLAAPAWAGMPISKDVTCPIGGETFSIITTPSCSVFGRTLMLKPRTSCEFVTVLPICPSNGLPLFTEFTEPQLKTLRALMETERYAEITKLPPWPRAYALAAELDLAATDTPFRILLQQLWEDPAVFLATESNVDMFLADGRSEIDRLEVGQRAVLQALLALVAGHAGRPTDASDLIAAAQADEPASGPARYVDAIAKCLADVAVAECALDATFMR